MFVQRDQTTLAFDRTPTLLTLAPGVAFTVILVVSALISVVRIAGRILSGRA